MYGTVIYLGDENTFENTYFPVEDLPEFLAYLADEAAKIDKGMEMSKTVILDFLKRNYSARWNTDDNSLHLAKANGRGNPIAFAKASPKTKMGEGKRREIVYQLSHRPMAMYDNTEYNHKWVDDIEIPQLGEFQQHVEMLAFYDALMPKMPKGSRYKSLEIFRTEMEDFLNVEPEKVRQLMESYGLGYNPRENIHLQALEVASGVRGKASFTLEKLVTELTHTTKPVVDRGEKMADTFGGRMVKQMKRNATIGVVGALNRKSIDLITSQPNCPDFLRTDVGKLALEGIVPMILMYGLETPYAAKFPAPLREKMHDLASAAFDSFGQNSANQVVELAFKVLGPVIDEWANAARDLEGVAAITDQQEQTLDSVLAAPQRERAFARDLG